MTVLAAKQSKSAGLETLSGDEIRAGSPLPFGAHQEGEGVNFALFSRHATRVLLELYGSPDACSPTRAIDLDPTRHRTGDVWHVWVRGISAGQLYAYRIDGPYDPQQGHRFNVNKLLLDPFATALAGIKKWDFEAARGHDSSSDLTDLSFSTLDDANSTPKCLLTDAHFDWEGDLPLRHPAADTVIYEAHVRGFSIDPSSGADPGRKSFAWVILGQPGADLFLMFNTDTVPADSSIPAVRGNKIWCLAVDTSRTAPEDLNEPGKEPSMQDQISFRVEPRSSAIFLARG